MSREIADRSSWEPAEGWIRGEVRLRALWWGDASAMTHGTDHDAIMVFLHGLGDGADIWRPTLSNWPGQLRFPAVALDLPGHGGSDWLAATDYTENVMVECIASALEHIQCKTIILIGHSLGAKIVSKLSSRLRDVMLSVLLDMAEAHNAVVDAAILEHIEALIAGAPTRDTLLEVYSNRLPVADPMALQQAVPALAKARMFGDTDRPQNASSEGAPWAIPLDPAIKRLINSGDEDQTQVRLRRVSTPVALARGQFSGVLSASGLQRMREALPSCVGADVIRGAGHAIPVDAPAETAQTLWRWISVARP